MRCCRAVVIRNHTNTQLQGVALSHRTIMSLAFLPKAARRFTLACDIHILVIHKHTAPSTSATWVAH